VNGAADQYNFDDTASVALPSLPPTYDTALLVVFRTNNYLEDSYYVTDASGNVVWSRVAANLQPNTTYMDTLHLSGGCYDISIYDTGGDGLSFWANTAQGSGTFRLKRLYQPNTIYVKTFGSDFGNFIHWSFYMVPKYWVGVNEVEDHKAVMEVFPNPVIDRAVIEYNFNEPVKPVLQIIDGLGRVIKEERLLKKDDNYSLDISGLVRGIYFIKLQGGNEVLMKKVVKE
jgi:hypothetical protein